VTGDPLPGPRRERQVLLLGLLIVVLVLGIQVLGVLFPGFGRLVGRTPLVIGVLVGVTLIVLLRLGMRRRR
jgi:hypothetical protein